jgi:hypothetical protein
MGSVSGAVAVVDQTVLVQTGTTWSVSQQGLAGSAPGAGSVLSAGTIFTTAAGYTALSWYTKVGNSWAVQQTTPLLGFGYAISGNVSVQVSSIGASVYERANNVWTLVQTITAPPGAAAFGSSLGVSGNTIAIGDDQAVTTVGSTFYTGLVYLWQRQANGSWVLQDPPLVEPIELPGGTQDNFAQTLAISGDLIVVGAPHSFAQTDGGFQGAIYVYTRPPNGVWGAGQQILSMNGNPDEGFGTSLAASGNTIVVGAPAANAPIPPAGAAYVITRSGTTWTQQRIQASDATAADGFGTWVGASGRTVVIGSLTNTYFYVGFADAGEACQANADCLGKNCVHGVCCSTACNGACKSCSTGTCLPIMSAPDPNGCSGSQTCDATGTCVCANPVLGGVCCSTPCAGPCKTCAPGGTCTAIANADDPAGCSGIRTCDAHGICSLKDGQSSTLAAACASGFLSDGFCCNSACNNPCDVCAASLGSSADGKCAATPAGRIASPACANGMVCDGNHVTCPGAACASDASCSPGFYCDASGSCQPERSQGSACDASAGADCKVAGCRVCATGHCTDGVCCAAAACPACEACAASLQAPKGVNGKCGPSLAGSDPHHDCVADPGYPSSCKADGKCDGLGSCRMFALPSVSCGATTCVGGMVAGLLCDGKGSCAASAGASCTPFECAGVACANTCTADSDCAAGAYCSAAHTCEGKKTVGLACTSNSECAPVGSAPGQCVDGVCCDSICGGQCQACDVSGHVGSCVRVPSGAPHGTRPDCAGVGTTCGGSCDGTSTACAFPLTGASCGSVCAGGQLTASSCDGNGNCVQTAVQACPGNLGCASPTACSVSCATDSDCIGGAVCAPDHTCTLVVGSRCLNDRTAANPSTVDSDGGVMDCAPYLCERGTGLCKNSCASVLDCVSPNVCNANNRCGPAPPKAAASSGCALGSAGSLGGGWAHVGLLGWTLLALLRRRAHRVRAGHRLR